MGHEWVDTGAAKLHIRRWGPEGGQAMLFLHSLGPAASGALLGPGVGPLVEAGWSIVAPDMPGFGESPPLDADGYRAERLATMVWALADALGWHRFVLSGHSWGGSVAVHAAAAQPDRVRALVLVDSGHLDYADQPGANLDESLDQLTANMEAARRRAPDRASVASDLELAVDDPVVEAFMAGMTSDGEGGLISRTTGASRAGAMYHLMRARQSDQWAALAAGGFPTLLLLASKPEEIKAMNEAAGARFASALPHADVRFVDATHSLITDLRQAFGATVAEWLAGLD